jgi:hypothetical protein
LTQLYEGLADATQVIRAICANVAPDRAVLKRLDWRAEPVEGMLLLRLPVDYMVFRQGPEALSCVVQIPHARTEVHLAALAPQIFTDLQARGVWMTQIRRGELDAAHDYLCDLSLATIASVRTIPDLVILSIHGFVPSLSNRLDDTDIIVSGGTYYPTGRTLRMYEALRKRYRHRDQVLLFPWQTYQLGGTTNAQGQILRSFGYYESFLHFELSRTFRDELREKDAARREFSEVLQDGLTAKLDKSMLHLVDPWHNSIGELLRRKLSGEQMIIAALGVSAEEYAERYAGHPRRIAKALGVSHAEVKHYLSLDPPMTAG